MALDKVLTGGRHGIRGRNCVALSAAARAKARESGALLLQISCIVFKFFSILDNLTVPILTTRPCASSANSRVPRACARVQGAPRGGGRASLLTVQVRPRSSLGLNRASPAQSTRLVDSMPASASFDRFASRAGGAQLVRALGSPSPLASTACLFFFEKRR